MTRRSGRPSHARGFTLIEAVMASLVVAIVFTGAMHAVGASGADQARAARRSAATFLADSLANEMLARPYKAAAAGSTGITVNLGIISITLGGGLSGTTDGLGGSGSSRAAFASIDDYNGLVDSPPHDVDGTAIGGFTGWSREVRVQTVSAADGSTASGTDAGAKLVTVMVKWGAGVVETRRVVMTNVP